MTVEVNLSGVTVEIGFGADADGGAYFLLDDATKGALDNVTYTLAPATVYVDVTANVRSIDIDRGRERELDEYATGKAQVVLNDNDRTFDPSYSGSPYAGQITPMRRIRIMWQGFSLFQGWIEDWSVTYEPGDKLSRVTADCIDGFGILANQQLDDITAAYSGDLSGERIVRVLNRTEVNFPSTRDIDDGNTVLGDTTLGGNVLTYLQECARAENGFLFVAADGTLTFRNRHTAINASTAAVLSDHPSSTEWPYRNLTQRSAADLLFTRVTAASETTGTVVGSVDTAAESEFLIRSLDLGTLLTIDDATTQNIVDSYLDRFSSVDVRFHSAEINTAALNTTGVLTITQLDLTDVVSVVRTPLGIGSAITKLSLVDGIKHHIGHGTWTTELSFANADTRSFLVLDDASLGLLDTDRLAF